MQIGLSTAELGLHSYVRQFCFAELKKSVKKTISSREAGEYSLIS
jgi:hypothetical protein